MKRMHMPVHNGENFVCEALDSITKQTYAQLEILIVDDNSDIRLLISSILKDNGFKKAPTRVVPNFLLGFLAFFLKDIALFKDRLGKSQVTKADNAKKLLLWKPNFVEKAIIGTAKQYRETRKL